MKSVCVFPGQGSQRPGMGGGLFERYPALVAEADACLGYSIAELCLDDPRQVLNQTEYTQPALYVVSALAYLERLAQGQARPDFVAGHSLGEYCALFAAGAFDFITGLKLVKRRGALMSRAPKGAMAAVVNLTLAQVEAILAALPMRNIDIANINARTQIILSGLYDELMSPQVQASVEAAGGTFIALKVSAAFHSRCMQGVQAEFAAYLSTFALAELQIPVVANYSARPYPRSGYADLLNLQIAGRVRWYESVSWMIAQGAGRFEEIGPGNVLARLGEQIVRDPLPVADGERCAPAATPPGHARPAAPPSTQLIFMFGGQGSQYFQMGRGLYDANPAFRLALDACSKAYQAACGDSLVDAMYRDAGPGGVFDDVMYTHAALYSIGYSLSELLRADGVVPDAVLGHGMGEYIAAAVAGAIDPWEGLDLVIRQARVLKARCSGGLLAVLAPSPLFGERPDLFAGVTLAGVNYAAGFVVSGADAPLQQVQARLEQEGQIAIRLPVRQGFHSASIDPAFDECMALGRRLAVSAARLPVYSSARGTVLGSELLERQEHYLWDVIRGETKFDQLMANAFDPALDHFFVDLSASGSFANFLKYGHGGRFRCAAAIDQFGDDRGTLDQLRSKLDDWAARQRGAGARLPVQ